MVKPLLIGIIGGIAGAVIVLGGLIAYSPNQSELGSDLRLAQQYQDKHDSIMKQTCMNSPPPPSLSEAKEVLKEAQSKLQLLINYQDELSELENKMNSIQEKYSGVERDYFILKDGECLYEKEWQQAISSLQEYLQNP